MRFLNWLMALLCVTAVAACGGGGGSSGTTPFPSPIGGGGTTTAAKLKVDVSSINITSAAPATVTLTLTDASGQPVKQAVIKVSTELGLGEFLVETVLTDNNGIATAVLKANTAGNAGADSISASATVGTETVTGSAGFQVAGGGTGTVPTLALAISSQVITSTAPATVTFTLKDANGAAVPQAIVSISTSRQIAVFAVPTILTDSNGVATALLQANASGAAGADAVVASAVVGTATIAGSVAYEVTGSSTTGAAPAKVELVASANTVGSGSSPITITAVVKGANNVAIADTPVVFSADTGTLANAGTVTDGNGAATAKLSAGQNKSNRTANITVTAGGASGTIPIEINGTVLSLSGATTLALGTSTTLTVTASDSQGGAIAGQAIAVTSSLSSVPTSLTTNSSGLATLVYTPTAAGTDNVSISGIGATAQRSILVSGQDFKFTSPAPDATINIGASGAMTVRYLVNGAVPAGSFVVQFTSTAGVFTTASATTGLPLQSDGTATASLSSNFAGPATVQATIFSAATPSISIAQATVAVKFIATTAYALTLQASPSAIGPNPAGSQLQYSTIRATLLDQFKNP